MNGVNADSTPPTMEPRTMAANSARNERLVNTAPISRKTVKSPKRSRSCVSRRLGISRAVPKTQSTIARVMTAAKCSDSSGYRSAFRSPGSNSAVVGK